MADEDGDVVDLAKKRLVLVVPSTIPRRCKTVREMIIVVIWAYNIL